jgi:N,N'-diacetylchitobiose transport system substrate-binding protein
MPWEMRMRVRHIAAAALVAALAVAATAATGASGGSAATNLTVWLQTDVTSNPTWVQLVKSTNTAFEKSHPGWNVDVQYQTWGTHLQKFDATLAGGNTPDVIEMGNTEMTKYMAAGAFKSLTQSAFPNNKTWLQGLKGSCQYNGKLYGVPYYAGARAVIYRKDQYKSAGIKSTPKSLAQFIADGKKLMKKYGKDGGYSAIYFPG